MKEIKCFPFVFTKDLYDKIVQNKKTVTRRLQRKRVAEDKVYRFRKGYKPTEHLIRVSRVYQQKLGDMTEEDALKEGCFPLSKFKVLWKSLYGVWNENEVVWVIEFKCLK